jgi:MFS family permease
MESNSSKSYKFSEEELNKGIEIVLNQKIRYVLFLSFIFCLINIAIWSIFALTPIFLFERNYLCKEINTNNNEFTRPCKLKEICINNYREDIDYKLGPSLLTNTLASDLDFECSEGKKSSIAASFYITGIIVHIFIPSIVHRIGLVYSISISNLITVICVIVMYFAKNFWLFIVFYFISVAMLQALAMTLGLYMAEMIKQKLTGPIYGIFLITIKISATIASFIVQLTSNYKDVYIFSFVTMLFCTIITHFFIVDSVRTRFVMNDLDRVIKDLQFISKFNGVYNEFNEWRNELKKKNNELCEVKMERSNNFN